MTKEEKFKILQELWGPEDELQEDNDINEQAIYF